MTGAYTVQVGYTSHRPIRVDEHITRVRVAADSDTGAVLTAAQLVGTRVTWNVESETEEWQALDVFGRPGCEMVTSTLLLDWPES